MCTQGLVTVILNWRPHARGLATRGVHVSQNMTLNLRGKMPKYPSPRSETLGLTRAQFSQGYRKCSVAIVFPAQLVATLTNTDSEACAMPARVCCCCNDLDTDFSTCQAAADHTGKWFITRTVLAATSLSRA